jgi:hypothetical protein
VKPQTSNFFRLHVEVGAFQSEDTISVIPIISVLKIVLFAWVNILLLLPLAFPMHQALQQLAYLDTLRSSLVALPFAIGVALFLISGVGVYDIE